MDDYTELRITSKSSQDIQKSLLRFLQKAWTRHFGVLSDDVSDLFSTAQQSKSVETEYFKQTVLTYIYRAIR